MTDVLPKVSAICRLKERKEQRGRMNGGDEALTFPRGGKLNRFAFCSILLIALDIRLIGRAPTEIKSDCKYLTVASVRRHFAALVREGEIARVSSFDFFDGFLGK